MVESNIGATDTSTPFGQQSAGRFPVHQTNSALFFAGALGPIFVIEMTILDPIQRALNRETVAIWRGLLLLIHIITSGKSYRMIRLRAR